MDAKELQKIVEGALMAAGRPLTLDDLMNLFGPDEDHRPARDQVRATLEDIEQDCRDRGFELKRVASGYRFQVRQELAQWIGRLWQERPQKYTRALLETLAIIAYRQPVTRGEIEEIRGVSVSSNIVKTLLEREWIRIVGHRDVPGRPAILATTRQFLDYFNLRKLDDLPPLSEIRDLVEIAPELKLEDEAGVDSAPQPDSGPDSVTDDESSVGSSDRDADSDSQADSDSMAVLDNELSPDSDTTSEGDESLDNRASEFGDDH